MMNIFEVNKRLKQRPPFQMIEKVTELIPNESAVGIKNVSINEPYFAGHFPGTPIMPGVLIIESCVLPGDTLTLKVTKTQSGGTLTYFDAVAEVDGQVRAKGSMVFTAIPKESLDG